MNKKLSLLIRLFTLVTVLALLAGSCKKDEDVNNGNAPQTFTDPRDGNVYKYIKIGSQIWMAENLRYLPSVSEPATGSETSPCYYVYGYKGTSADGAKASFNYGAYGVLYNWAAAKAACPYGWHLPTSSEWTQLANYLGGEQVAGGKLRESGIAHWRASDTGVTNEVGFTALPGGFRNIDGTFQSTGYRGYWWSATEGNESYSAWFIHLSYNSMGIGTNSFSNSKIGGLSVRCVRD